MLVVKDGDEVADSVSKYLSPIIDGSVDKIATVFKGRFDKK